MLTYKEKYDLNSPFLTNFAELMECISIDLNNNEQKIKQEYYTYSCLFDNFSDQGISCSSFHIEYLDNSNIDFDI